MGGLGSALGEEGEVKQGHLCQGVLKWSQKAIKEEGLMHILIM